MPPYPPHSGGPTLPVSALDRTRVLVRASSPPPLPTDRCVDVRPGAHAAFDGDRVRLALAVTRGPVRERVDWADPTGLEAAVTAALRPRRGAAVRYGDRVAIQTALGTGQARAIVRQLGAVADAHEATLVTWTSGSPRPADRRAYDLVVDGTGSRIG